jgi:hypothetical protein
MMNRYEASIPRAAAAWPPFAITALVFGLAVVLPPQSTATAAATLRPYVRPALLLTLHDLDHAGRDVADLAQHVRRRELLGPHGVLARNDLLHPRPRLVDAVADDRVSLQHPDAGP